MFASKEEELLSSLKDWKLELLEVADAHCRVQCTSVPVERDGVIWGREWTYLFLDFTFHLIHFLMS